MSYVLNYKGWRKLHESAAYRKIYEQAFVKGGSVTSIVLSGTSQTPVQEQTQLKYGLVAAKGKAPSLYEISLKDALAQNFGSATFVKALEANEPKDQFLILNTGNEVISEHKGLNQTITFTVNKNNLNDLKIRFAGNGVLAMHRASIQTKKLPQDSGYHVRLYMAFAKSPIEKLDVGSTDETRFSILVGVNVSELLSESRLITQIMLGVIGYMSNDATIKKQIVTNLDRVNGNNLYSTQVYPGGDFSKLKAYPVGILSPTGKGTYIRQDEVVEDPIITPLKDSVSTDTLFKIDSFHTTIPQTEQDKIKADPDFNKTMAAIYQYIGIVGRKLMNEQINIYFDDELKGLDEDLLSELKKTATDKTREGLKAISAKYPPTGNQYKAVDNSIRKDFLISLKKIADIINTYVLGKTPEATKKIPTTPSSGGSTKATFAEAGTEGEEKTSAVTNK
jgi:hypothetical protein